MLPERVEQMREETRKEKLELFPMMLVYCPFCLALNSIRTMVKFNEKDEVLENLKCPACGKGMERASARATIDPFEFGKFAGSYIGFWKEVNHDQWIHTFKERFDRSAQNKFWEGYGSKKPEFKEKHDIEDAWKKYEQANATKPSL